MSMTQQEHPELVADFFDTIEEAGLSDIAAEVGIAVGTATFTKRSIAESNGTLRGTGSAPTACTTVLGGISSPAAGPSVEDPVDDDDVKTPLGVHAPGVSSTSLALTDSLEPAAKKKRLQRAHGGKQQGDKGLRHFSMKVCEKVEQKVRTTYNEVADELVAEFAVAATEMVSAVDQAYDEKNIRRRVYDALNVLMAMDIITKEKKNIMWRGLPTNTEQEGARLQMDLGSRKERIEKKTQHLQELVTQQISFKNLVRRNGPEVNQEGERIPLPFIVVNTRKETVIDCEMAEDRQEIFFNFSSPFEIHDDTEILTRMHMQHCDVGHLSSVVPEELIDFTAHHLHRNQNETPSAIWQPPGLAERCRQEETGPPVVLSASPQLISDTPSNSFQQQVEARAGAKT